MKHSQLLMGRNRFVARLRIALILMLGIFGAATEAAETTYQYDSSGRLKRVVYPDSSTKDYTLDAAGNRTQVQAQPPSGDATRPSSPGAVTFASVTHNSITVNWGAATDNVAVTGYDYQVNGGAWQSINNVLTVILGSLTASTSYTVQVRARDAAGNTSLTPSSNVVTTAAAPDVTRPSSPGAISFTGVLHSSVTVNWGAATDNIAVTGYDYQVNGGSWVTLGNVLMVNVTGLTASTNYSFQVRARDAAGNTSQTPTFNSVTTAPPPDITPPSSPGAVIFTSVTSSALTANWGAATDNVAVTGYDYQVNSGGWQLLGNVLTVNVSGLSASTSYTVQVRARDGAGNTSATPSSNSITTPAPTPATPQWVGFLATCVPSCIIMGDASLQWSAVSGATYYELQRSTGWDLSAMSPFAAHYSGSATSFFQSFDTRTPYPGYDGYRVRACNSNGCSLYSTIYITMDIGEIGP